VFAGRDIRREDWQTFANYLLPHHSAASNEQVIDRKLRAEAMTATNNNTNNDDTRSQTSGRSHAEAHLNRIRSPVDVDTAQNRENVEATVREWNDGFFAPRRVTIRVDLDSPTTNNTNNNGGLRELPPQPESDTHPHPQPQPYNIPGAWDTSFDQPAQETNNTTNPTRPNPSPGPARGGGGGGFFPTFNRWSNCARGPPGPPAGPQHHSGGGGGGFSFAGINV
jgi:hypothetical protein